MRGLGIEGLKLLLVATCLGATLPIMAQSGASAASARFEKVSIVRHAGSDSAVHVEMTDQSYSALGVTLADLIGYAFGLQVPEEEVAGLAGSVRDARFDITGSFDLNKVAGGNRKMLDGQVEVQSEMVRRMLADRFGLSVHHETREMPIYALVVAEGGFKAKDATRASVSADAPQDGSMSVGPGKITAETMPISGLVRGLEVQVHRVVRDRTGLRGSYSYSLEFAREDQSAPLQPVVGGQSGPAREDFRPLFRALEEQLGLKLDATTGPVETVVVDHAVLPSVD